MERVNLEEKFSAFSEHWRPKVAAELNGQEVKLVKFQGQFLWHHHEAEDELFFVWRGRMQVEFRDRVVTLSPWRRANFSSSRAESSIEPPPTKRQK
jgi:mannose-6-phosphate isomerase-like protein (cupin superfamily)